MKKINQMFYLVNVLRCWIPKVDSEKFKIKQDIIKEFKRQGVDYYSTLIPKSRLEQIKIVYPDTWEKYIKIY